MDWTSRKIQCRLSNNQKKLLKFLQFLNRDLYRLRHSHAYNIFLAPLLIRRARTHRERERVCWIFLPFFFIKSIPHYTKTYYCDALFWFIIFKTHPQEIMALYRRFYWTNLYSLLFIHSRPFFYWKRLLHHYIYSIVHISLNVEVSNCIQWTLLNRCTYSLFSVDNRKPNIVAAFTVDACDSTRS